MTYLKIQGSAAWLSRLLCDCSSRKTSTANGAQLGELKKKRNDKLASPDDELPPDKKIKGEQVLIPLRI